MFVLDVSHFDTLYKVIVIIVNRVESIFKARQGNVSEAICNINISLMYVCMYVTEKGSNRKC